MREHRRQRVPRPRAQRSSSGRCKQPMIWTLRPRAQRPRSRCTMQSMHCPMRWRGSTTLPIMQKRRRVPRESRRLRRGRPAFYACRRAPPGHTPPMRHERMVVPIIQRQFVALEKQIMAPELARDASRTNGQPNIWRRSLLSRSNIWLSSCFGTHPCVADEWSTKLFSATSRFQEATYYGCRAGRDVPMRHGRVINPITQRPIVELKE